VVTTETCGMMDMVEDRHNGLLVKPANSAEFASAVQRLMDSPQLRARLGCAARETMRRHTWNRVAEQLENVFGIAVAE
jgi:glycosyltransferase involved in cell wall biosynthesis